MKSRNLISLLVMIGIIVFVYSYKKSVEIIGDSYFAIAEIKHITAHRSHFEYTCDGQVFDIYTGMKPFSKVGECYEILIQKDDCERFELLMERPVFKEGIETNFVLGEVYMHNESLNFVKYEYKVGDTEFENSQYLFEGGKIDSLLEHDHLKFWVEYNVNFPSHSRIIDERPDEILFLESK